MHHVLLARTSRGAARALMTDMLGRASLSPYGDTTSQQPTRKVMVGFTKS
jgi:hypothetical protein